MIVMTQQIQEVQRTAMIKKKKKSRPIILKLCRNKDKEKS